MGQSINSSSLSLRLSWLVPRVSGATTWALTVQQPPQLKQRKRRSTGANSRPDGSRPGSTSAYKTRANERRRKPLLTAGLITGTARWRNPLVSDGIYGVKNLPSGCQLPFATAKTRLSAVAQFGITGI